MIVPIRHPSPIMAVKATHSNNLFCMPVKWKENFPLYATLQKKQIIIQCDFFYSFRHTWLHFIIHEDISPSREKKKLILGNVASAEILQELLPDIDTHISLYFYKGLAERILAKRTEGYLTVPSENNQSNQSSRDRRVPRTFRFYHFQNHNISSLHLSAVAAPEVQ